jgi:hypothetical protein
VSGASDIKNQLRGFGSGFTYNLSPKTWHLQFTGFGSGFTCNLSPETWHL